MKQIAFNIYEIENQYDEERAIAELQRMGATHINVTARDYRSGIRVQCTLPDDIGLKDIALLTSLCL